MQMFWNRATERGRALGFAILVALARRASAPRTAASPAAGPGPAVRASDVELENDSHADMGVSPVPDAPWISTSV